MQYSKYFILVISVLWLFPGRAHSSERIDSAEAVLLGSCLADYRGKYKNSGKRKSFAIASDKNGAQVCAWRRTAMFSGPADYDALQACEKRRAKRNIQDKCVVVDRDGNLVVERGVLPEWRVGGYDFPVGKQYIDLHDRAMVVLEGSTCQRQFRRYILHGGFKAFAYTVSKRGVYGICTFYTRHSPNLSESLALKKCNERRASKIYIETDTPECKLFAVNNDILLSRKDYGLPPYEPDSLNRVRRLHLITIQKYFRKGEDINQVDRKGKTALLYSVESDRLDVVRFLVSKNADVNLADNKGNTPLKIAKKRNYNDIAEFLEQNGALESPVVAEKTSEVLDLSDVRPVQPKTVPGETMTTELVLRFLKSMRATEEPLDRLQAKLKDDKAANKMVSGAVTKGEMLRTMVAIAEKIDEVENVRTAVREAGFQSIEDWAYVGDRIISVMFVNEMLSAIAPISFSGKGFPEGANISEFIADESNPEELRAELFERLEASCQTDCVVPADLAVVSEHIAEIKSAFEGM